MNKFTVGIIGFGFVGEAQAYAFTPTADVKIYDVNPVKKTHELDEVLQQEFIFICVPTPMKLDGSQDLSYIEKFFESITVPIKKDTIFIIKSTVLPGTTEKLNEKYKYNIIFSPEFLTEKTFYLDTVTQTRIIFGGYPHLTSRVEALFVERFGPKNYIHTDSTTAEFIKYMSNCFLATKVSVMNEFYLVAQKLGVNWKDALDGCTADPRIGNSHTQVPGHDGHMGYGGTCLLPGAKILMPDGNSVKIENSLESVILSANNEINSIENKKIISVISRKYSGLIYSFKTRYGTMQCTEDHLIPIERDGVQLLLPAKNIRFSDKFYIYNKRENT